MEVLPTPFSPKAFPKTLQPNCTGVLSVSIGLRTNHMAPDPPTAKSRNHNCFLQRE